ncbi:hypothetical protein BpHYR1_003825 [Brachionus plicatilis]|uniref:Ig-like domain-containing protein n=1 Tax=Brachionus plicatilis TaxID=10195 RepID=A0A3M7RT22_BRAPC|nr:hypothetical protein BpHYR1_003825 [Brachionus plicatilis]
MRLYSILISILVASSIYCQDDEVQNLPTAPGLVKSEVRKTEIEEYSLNILVNINVPLNLNTIKDSNAVSWSLIQQKNGTSEDKKTPKLTLFNAVDSSAINSTIKTQFLCLPTESKCDSLRVPNFGPKYLGSYSNQALASNSLKNFLVDFNISAYMNHLEFKCDSLDCIYNESGRFLTVLSGKSIPIECSIIVAQNSLFTPAAELVISSDINKLDHCQIDTKFEQIPQSEIHSYLNSSSDIKIYLFKISKRCSQVFNKRDNGKSIRCDLKSVNQSAPSELQNLRVLESVSNTMDVHYDPEIIMNGEHQLNKTVFEDQAETSHFSCPIESNPLPIYEWRVKSVLYNNTDPKAIFLTPTEFSPSKREFLIRKDLGVGFYQFECRARTQGLVNRVSDGVVFNLDIKVGGVVGLVVIAVIVLLVLRRSKSNTSNEESGKTQSKIYNSGKKAKLNVVKENKNKSDTSQETAHLKSNKVDQNN